MQRGLLPIDIDKLFIKLKSIEENNRYRFKMHYTMEDPGTHVNQSCYSKIYRVMRDQKKDNTHDIKENATAPPSSHLENLSLLSGVGAQVKNAVHMLFRRTATI